MASIARAFCDRDTTIFEKSITANAGGSPILQLSNIYNGIKLTKQFERVLIRFGLSSLTGNIVTTKKYPDPRTDSTVTAYLYMFNAPHGDAQAKSFDLEVYPITQDWSEGDGLDLDELTQTGYANAVSAQSTVAWTTSGGTWQRDANSATQNFDTGEENLKVNITNLFKEWLDGNTANFGVLVKMTDLQEARTGSTSATSIDYKKFYGRATNTRKQPYIQLEWDGAVKDDRNFVPFNSTANLFFFNIQNGQLTDLDGTSAFPGNITLSGLSAGTAGATGSVSAASWTALHTTLTAARHEKGVYKINFTMPLSGNNYTQFKDRWYLSASPTANYTFDFTSIDPTSGYDNFVTSKYRVALKNLRTLYERGTVSRVRMNIKDDSLILTALTAGSTAVNNFIVTDGTVEIRELEADTIEIPAVKLSYDKNGNFFDLDTNNLYWGVAYKPVFKLNVRGETFYYDDPKHWHFEII